MATATNQLQNVGAEVKDAAANLADQAKDVAGKVADQAGHLAHQVAGQADSAVESVGGSLKTFAGTIREKMPHTGVLGSASESVAGALESSGRYLEEKGLSGIGEDATALVKRHPVPVVLLALGLGFLIARSARR